MEKKTTDSKLEYEELWDMFADPMKRKKRESEITEKQEKIKKDVEIIKPYLISKGYDFSNKSGSDIFAYNIARKDNLIYLSLGMFYYLGEEYYEPKYDSKFCQIIYDTNGKVLLDCIKYKSNNCIRIGWHPETWIEHDPSYIFMDDYVLIDKIEHSDIPYYSIYKLENGTYSLIDEYRKVNTELIKTSRDELFLKNSGRLYSVRNAKYVNDLRFKDIIDATACKNYWFDPQIGHINKEAIYNVLQNNNLLFAYDYIHSNASAYKSAIVFVFLDANGNIASKLYCSSKSATYTIDVDNNSYNQVLELCRKKLDEEVYRERALETRRYKRELEAYNKLLEELSNDFGSNEESKGVQKTKI